MSATNRNPATRVNSDNYPTPGWATRRLIEALREHYCFMLPYSSILEPCCGEGAIIRELRAAGARGHITGCDVRLEALPYASASGASRTLESRAQDFRALPRFDAAITNPPFDQAGDLEDASGTITPGIINATLENAFLCAFLLRSAFRLNAFRANMPDELKLPQRPEFVASDRCKGGGYYEDSSPRERDCGWSQKVRLGTARPTSCPVCLGQVQRSTSDSSEYSWFVWANRGNTSGVVRLLPDTPLAERKALPEAA